MKPFQVILLILLSAIYIICVLDYREGRKEHEELIYAINNRNHLDSLMAEHYRECSFISSKELAVGYDGYIYSKYHKNK